MARRVLPFTFFYAMMLRRRYAAAAYFITIYAFDIAAPPLRHAPC